MGRPERTREHERRGTGGSERQRDGAAVLRSERGVALVLAIVMLLLLGILGTMALSTSMTELRITGNYRNSQTAFFAAEAAVEYAYSDPAIYTAMIMSPTSPNNSWPVMGAGDWPALVGTHTTVTMGSETTRIRVQFEACGIAPPGYGISSEYSAPGSSSSQNINKVNYMLVSTVGEGPNDTESIIESRQMRLTPDCLL